MSSEPCPSGTDLSDADPTTGPQPAPPDPAATLDRITDAVAAAHRARVPF